jgi:hypothetical protein
VDSVHGPWTTAGPSPRWTGHGRRHRAHRSLASGRSGSPTLDGGSRGGGVGHRGLRLGLTGAQEVVEQLHDGGVGGGGGALGVGSLRVWREGKEGRGRSGEERGVGAPFYRVGGGSGMAGRGGESSSRMVWRHWWPSGAITPAVSALNEGKTDEGVGKSQGWHPLPGGEGADGEAAGRGGTPVLGR